MVCDLAGLLN
jgi:hypothetical protein